GVDDQPVVGRLCAGDVYPGGQTEDVNAARVAGDHDHVVAGGTVDDDGVGLAVAAGRARQVEVDPRHAGAGQVVDGDRVGATEGGDVHLLDAVGVHDHVGDVAGEAQPGAVGRQVDLLVDVGAVELQGVLAILTLDGVVAVAGVPREGVVAGAAEEGVVALATDHQVVTVATEQHVVAVAAGDRVVTRAAIDYQTNQRREPVPGRHGVVAAVGVEDQALGGTDVQGERGRVRAVEAHPGPVGRHGEGLVAVAAVDLDGVDAVAALVEVGVVAGVPDHPVVAGLAEGQIVAV